MTRVVVEPDTGGAASGEAGPVERVSTVVSPFTSGPSCSSVGSFEVALGGHSPIKSTSTKSGR